MSSNDSQLTALQKFFMDLKEIKVTEFAKMVGIDATLLRNYINGFKKPSQAREKIYWLESTYLPVKMPTQLFSFGEFYSSVFWDCLMLELVCEGKLILSEMLMKKNGRSPISAGVPFKP